MIRVGVVARPHGVRGELVVTLDAEKSTSLLEAAHVRFGDRPPLRILHARKGRPGQVVLDVGYTAPEQVDALRGAEVKVEEVELAPLEVNEFWHRDLVGLVAVLASGEELGRVAEVVDTAEVAVLVVQVPGAGVEGSGDEVFVPFADPYVIEVDVRGGRIVVAPPAE